MEHKGRSTEVIQPEEQREKIEKEIKQSFRYTLNNIKLTDENIPGTSEGEKGGHEAGKISWEIIADNSPLNLKVFNFQEAQRILNRKNAKENRTYGYHGQTAENQK